MTAVRAIFGLGITSPEHALIRLRSYKRLAEQGSVAYVVASTAKWPIKAKVVVVAGANVLAKWIEKIRTEQVLVISEVPALLRSIGNVVPLDFNTKVSYVFNYVEPDFSKVANAVRGTAYVKLVYNNVDQLGYVVNNLKKADDTINALIGLLSNVPFLGRSKIYQAITAFFTAPTANTDNLIEVLDTQLKGTTLLDEKNRFIATFCDHAAAYHAAFNSKLASATAAEKYKVDAYALAYFKTKLNAQEPPKRRLAKQPTDGGMRHGRPA